MTRDDVAFVLQNLHFAQNGLATLRLDGPVRDFLVAALRRNGPACSR
jgi:hypothetical protein